MNDRSRWDPEMVANQQKFDAEAAKHPPVQPVQPLGPHRAVNEFLNLPYAQGGPDMAETVDRWVMGRGRRILCRTYRPRTDRILPTLVYLHGGGYVLGSIDSHRTLAAEVGRAAGGRTLALRRHHRGPCRNDGIHAGEHHPL